MGMAPPTDRASWGQTLGAGTAFAVAVALCAISATLNWRFGVSLGRTEADGQIYGAAAVCADVLKALSPFLIIAAWRARLWSHMLAGIAVWLVTTAFALTGALGHVSLNRGEVAAHREVASTNYMDLRDEQKRLKQALAWIPQHRAAASIEADMRGQQMHRLWTVTRSCTDATAPASREFCASYQKLVAELGSAKEAAALQARLDTASGKLAALGGATEADPQAKALSHLSGVDVAMVQTLLMLLIVALLEVGSGLAPYAAVALMRSPVAKRATPVAEDVASTATVSATPATPTVAKSEPDRARDDKDDDAGNGPPASPETTTVVQFPKATAVPSVAMSPGNAVAEPKKPKNWREAAADLPRVLATIGATPSIYRLAEIWGTNRGTVWRWMKRKDFNREVQRRMQAAEASHPLAA